MVFISQLLISMTNYVLFRLRSDHIFSRFSLIQKLSHVFIWGIEGGIICKQNIWPNQNSFLHWACELDISVTESMTFKFPYTRCLCHLLSGKPRLWQHPTQHAAHFCGSWARLSAQLCQVLHALCWPVPPDVPHPVHPSPTKQRLPSERPGPSLITANPFGPYSSPPFWSSKA